jgi:5-(carboxyamino)imidazole ribonucleotide synthase
MTPIQIGVVMGSSSDWDTMQHAVEILQQFGIAHEARVVSAHRMPDDMFAYAEAAAGRGLKAIIAGAGGAAHLPGMIAAKTTVPVLGVPVASRHLQGVDSLHSIVQMPKGIPVATFAIGTAGAANAALFAVALLANENPALRQQARSLPRRPDRGGAQHDLAARPMSQVTPSGTICHPGSTLGVMGGGQLGRMFVQAAQAMGYFTAVLDADPESPAGLVSHHHIQTGYLKTPTGLARLAALRRRHHRVRERARRALATLAGQCPVAPARDAVAVAQDRAQEKAHFVRCGVPCAPYAVIETAEQLAAVPADLLPGILKTARLGYDGKGQVRVKTAAELAAAWGSVGQVPCVLEKMLPLQLECSVIVARGADGATVHLPVQRNLHRDGILAVTEVYEENLPPALASQAVGAAISIAQGLDYVGVLCVEFFVLQDGSLVVNEIAPRPHNSGHYSQNACDVSQFELQVRTLAGLPLVQPRQHSAAVMLNLLGDLWFARGETAQTPPWAEVLACPARTCTCTARPWPSMAARWGT